MPFVIQDNFQLNVARPVDSRMVATNSTARNEIPTNVRYDGMKVFQLDNRQTYVWNGTISGTWSLESSDSVTGTGSSSFLTRWVSDSAVGNSIVYNLVNGTLSGLPVGFVGVNTPSSGTLAPKGALQINSSFVGGVPPTVLTKGTFTTLSENWYDDGASQVFDSTLGSTRITFNNGIIDFFVRAANSPASSFTQRFRIGMTSSVLYGPVTISNGDLTLSNTSRIFTGFLTASRGITVNDLFIQSKGTSTSPNSIGVVDISSMTYNSTPGGNFMDLDCFRSQIRYMRSLGPGTTIKFNIINGTASFIHQTTTVTGDPVSGYKKIWTPWGMNVWNLFPGSQVELTEDNTFWRITNLRQNNQPFIDINNSLLNGWVKTAFPLPNPGYRVIYEQSNAYIEMRGSVQYATGSIPITNVPFYQFPSEFGSFSTPHMFSSICFGSTNPNIATFTASSYLTSPASTWIYVDTNRNIFADPTACFQKDVSLFNVRIRLTNTNDITVNTTTTTTAGGGGGGS